MSSTLEVKLTGSPSTFSVLPLPEVLDYFEHRCALKPHLVGEYKSILMQISYLTSRSGNQIKMSFSESSRVQNQHLKNLTCEFVKDDLGSLYCPQCRTLINASDIVYERFNRGKIECNQARQTKGKRLLCRKNHLILELLDMRI